MYNVDFLNYLHIFVNNDALVHKQTWGIDEGLWYGHYYCVRKVGPWDNKSLLIPELLSEIIALSVGTVKWNT